MSSDGMVLKNVWYFERLLSSGWEAAGEISGMLVLFKYPATARALLLLYGPTNPKI